MVADEFAVSHGSDQPVAVTADRKLDDLTLNYRIAGGEAQTASVSEWEGGEKYGDTHDDFYAEFRGTVTGAAGQGPVPCSPRPTSYDIEANWDDLHPFINH